ncbi:hypothetical protein GQ53DRAFT_750638 [Thozetella sp. PMI_491]|nr:hypothetical protein GQ53DRAFT_750638 [Thozetella sp. PMI_491]
MKLSGAFVSGASFLSTVLGLPAKAPSDTPSRLPDANTTFRSADGNGTFGMTLTNYTSGGLQPRWRSELKHTDMEWSEKDLMLAMDCLEQTYCKPLRNRIPEKAIGICTVNHMLAAVCNYAFNANPLFPFTDNALNSCEGREMKSKWREFLWADNNPNHHGMGWWVEDDWGKAYTWDLLGTRPCTNLGGARIIWHLECLHGNCTKIVSPKNY